MCDSDCILEPADGETEVDPSPSSAFIHCLRLDMPLGPLGAAAALGALPSAACVGVPSTGDSAEEWGAEPEPNPESAPKLADTAASVASSSMPGETTASPRPSAPVGRLETEELCVEGAGAGADADADG